MAGTNVATLTAKLKADTSSLKTGFGKANRELSGFSKTSSQVMAGLGKAAVAGAAIAGAAVVGAAVKGVVAFADFERGMNEVFTLLPGISEDAMGDMEDDVKSLSKEFGILPDEAVPALYQALSAGVPPDNVFDFMETASKAAIGGATDLETAVDGLTSVVNAYGSENVTAAEASDIMFTAVRLGKTTMDELAGSMFQVNPVAAAMGVKVGDVAAAMAVLTSQGTPTSVAATELKSAFVELGKEGTIASDMFKEATGTTFPDFIAAGGTVEDAFNAMKDKAGDMDVGVGDLFGSVEAGMAVISLTSGSGSEAYGKAMDEMQTSTGATDKAFATMDQGLSRSWDKIKAQFSTALIDIGGKLAPFVEDFSTWFAEKMPAAIDTLMGWFDTAIGVVQNFVRGGQAIFDFFRNLPAPMQGVITKLGLVGAALIVLYANPVLAGLALVAGAVYLIGKNAKEAEERVDELRDILDGIEPLDAEFVITEVGRDEIIALLAVGFAFDDIKAALEGSEDEWKTFVAQVLASEDGLNDMSQAGIVAVGRLGGLRREFGKVGPKLSDMTTEMELTKRAAHRLNIEGVKDAENFAEGWSEAMETDDFDDFTDSLDDLGGNVGDVLGRVGDDVEDTFDGVSGELGDSASDFAEWEEQLGDKFDDVTGTLDASGIDWKRYADELGTAGERMLLEMSESLGGIISMWDSAPDQIEISVDEMIANLMETSKAKAEYKRVWQELMDAGLYALADELDEKGYVATDAMAALMEDTTKAAEMNFLLGGVISAEVASMITPEVLALGLAAGGRIEGSVEDGFDPTLETPDVDVDSRQAHSAGLNQAYNYIAGWGSPSITAPSVPSAGQTSSGSGKINSGGAVPMALGGIVTQPTLALLGEAGPEAVVPLNRTPGSSPLPFDLSGVKVMSESDAERVLTAALLNLSREGVIVDVFV